MLSQLQFPGMEGSAFKAPDQRSVLQRAFSPIPPPTPLEQRRSKMYANREAEGYLAGHRLRMEDSDVQEAKSWDEDTGDFLEHVPPTKLGEPGELRTEDYIKNVPWHGGMQVPHEMAFGSPQSAWRKHGHYEEVAVPELNTIQREFSSRRVKQIMDNPATADNPRLPYPERAHGFRHDENNVIVTDGNHRTMSHVLGGQMFVPMQVAGHEDVDNFGAQARRIRLMHDEAQYNENANPNWREEREAKINDRLYGTGNW